MNDETSEAKVVKPLGTVGRYALRRELASGGMATVYLANLTGPYGFEKVVAVKRIHPHLKKDRRFVEMFLDEARVAALIHHPNVCAVVDFGEENGAPYLVMEYLQGEPLTSVLRVGRAIGGVPYWLAARIVHDAARGLHAAHELRGPDGHPLGVVHRDVSPQNIFVLYDGITKVVDFGVARARGRLTVTGTNEVKGKLPYMSPEQYDGERVDRRTDVWALGVVLWETTVGLRLFRGENDGATIARVLHKPIPLPSEHRPDYPSELEAIVMKCLERDPERRYLTAEALAEDLEAFVYGTGKPAGASQVKRWMHEHFAAHITRGEALLRGESTEQTLEEDTGSTLSSIRHRSEPILGPSDPTVVWPPRDGEGAAPPTPRAIPVSAEADTVVARQLGGSASQPEIPVEYDENPAAKKRAVALAVAATVFAVLLVVGPRLSGPDPDAAESSIPVETPTLVADPPEAEPVEPAAAQEPSPPSDGLPANVVGPAVSVANSDTSPPATPSRSTTASASVTPTRSTAPAGESERPSRPVEVATPAAAPAPSPAPTRTAEPEASSSSSPGTLSVIAIPPATVRLAGRVLGETPLARIELPPGDHRIELTTADGRSQTVTVHIESGQATRRRVEFPAPAAP